MNQNIKTSGGRIFRETSANDVKGILCRTIPPEQFFFRVYHGDGNFDDYRILHDDLSVTIDDELASFYEDENGEKFLDHSPQVFGWETVDADE